MDRELPLRVVVVGPLPGVAYRLQRGKADLEEPARQDPETISFDFTVRVRAAGDALNLTGPYAQGPPTARFLYIGSGKHAGQQHSCWDRRAKVPLTGITKAQIEETLTTPGAVLEARIQGIGRDGGPACATVPIMGEGWQVVAPQPPTQ